MEREYIGIDLHKAFFQACTMRETGERQWEGRFARTPEGIARFIARGVGPHQVLAVEASGPTWAFVEALRHTGARICVVDPRKTKLKAGFAAKTDRLDARRLADAVRRDSVVSIYIPPPAIRELREVCRGRHQVVRLRTRVAQMIRALLLRTDAGDPPTDRLYSPRALAWLAQVRLSPDADCSLRRLERLFRAAHAEATAADAAVRQRAAADPIAGALGAMVGVGPVRALTIRAEIGDIARFRRGPELASYAGLVPRVDRRRLPLVALRLGSSGPQRDAAHRRHRALGAPARGAEGHLQGPRRVGAGAVRRGRRALATEPVMSSPRAARR